MRYAWLPLVLAEIADVAGLDAALCLAKARGGTRVYIPSFAPDDHWLVQTVGREAADAICSHFTFNVDGVARHGTKVMIPFGPRGSIAEVRATVDRMIAAGNSIREVALATGITSRSVERRKARIRDRDGRQARLL